MHAQVGAKKQGLAWQGSQIHGGRRNAVELREPWRSRVEGSWEGVDPGRCTAPKHRSYTAVETPEVEWEHFKTCNTFNFSKNTL